MRITAIWGVVFLVCDALTLLGSRPVRLFGPIALLIGTALAVPRLVRRYRTRLSATAPEGA